MTDASDGTRDFFVSFNQADRAWATWVAWVLEEARYSVFFQDWDFRGNFVEHMNRAHAQARRTLAVLSDNYFGSDFTLAEWSARFAQDPAAREDRLVPVKVGPLTGETIFDPIIHADLTGCEEAEAQRLLLGRVKRAVDAGYRDKPITRPGFPGGQPRQVPERPSFPPVEECHHPATGQRKAAAAPPRAHSTEDKAGSKPAKKREPDVLRNKGSIQHLRYDILYSQDIIDHPPLKRLIDKAMQEYVLPVLAMYDNRFNINWTTNLKLRTTVRTPDVISIFGMSQSNFGGAHSSYEWFCFNYDPVNKQCFTLSMIFRSEDHLARFWEIALQEVYKEKKKRSGDFNEDDFIYQWPPKNENIRYTLSNSMDNTSLISGLTLLFVPYELGCFAEGPYEVLILKKKLMPLVSERFAKLFQEH